MRANPPALVEVIDEEQASEAACAELTSTGSVNTINKAEVYAMIASRGNVGAALEGGKPESLTRLYERLGLQLRFEPQESAVYVEDCAGNALAADADDCCHVAWTVPTTAEPATP